MFSPRSVRHEGMDTKRVNGLFSMIAKPDRSLSSYGLELMGEAVNRVTDGDTINGLAAQVASDSPARLSFYQRFFRRQGSFPIYEALKAVRKKAVESGAMFPD